jgi:hypothetical protein
MTHMKSGQVQKLPVLHAVYGEERKAYVYCIIVSRTDISPKTK